MVSGNSESGVARHRRCRRAHTRVSCAARSHETCHCRHGGTQLVPHLRARMLSGVTPSPHRPPLGGHESSLQGRRTTGAAQDIGSRGGFGVHLNSAGAGFFFLLTAFRRVDAVPTLGCSECWVPVTATSVFIPGVTRKRGRPRQSGTRGAVLRPRPRLALSHSGGLCSPGLVSPRRARTSPVCVS